MKLASYVWLLGAAALVFQAQGKSQGVKRELRRTGKGKSGEFTTNREGKSGKGKSNSGECDCNGVTEYKYFEAELLLQLALARTSGADFGTVDLSMTPLTYSLAVSLAPPNCYIASSASDFEELRIQALGGAPGFVGAFTDVEDAYNNIQNLADIETRREGWAFLSGESVLDEFWNPGQPPLQNGLVENTPSVGLYTGTGMDAATLVDTAPGAYYKCCYSVVPNCFATDPNDLQNVLVPVIQAM